MARRPDLYQLSKIISWLIPSYQILWNYIVRNNLQGSISSNVKETNYEYFIPKIKLGNVVRHGSYSSFTIFKAFLAVTETLTNSPSTYINNSKAYIHFNHKIWQIEQ